MHYHSLLSLAHILSENGQLSPPYALFHSGQRGSGDSGRYSFLAYDAQENITGSNGDTLKNSIGTHGWWAGYFGYGLKNQLEVLTQDTPSAITLPDYHWLRFETVLRLDHDNGEIEAICGKLPAVMAKRGEAVTRQPERSEDRRSQSIEPHTDRGCITSPSRTHLQRSSTNTTFTREEYLNVVNDTISAISRGNFYEANITQKYWGELETAPSDPLALFATLATTANTPYSALLCLDKHTHIYSASPECFLKASADGSVTSHPIKGSMKRGNTSKEDNKLKEGLHQSTKNRAENLMIVDLIRNDLARVCKAGSVKVNALYHIESFETIHHMVSQISGKLLEENTALDAVLASFPPGSMTGAPKIAAMEWCSQKERLARGIYSGALGWLDGNGNMDLSVVIRTLIVQDTCYEYQVGGAIVADSTPEEEWDEMRLKAKVIESLFDECDHSRT
jgi:anthranilate/para-aminobenzoate synthase component I